jgi:formamidopyrimidine-DNA glycosylase
MPEIVEVQVQTDGLQAIVGHHLKNIEYVSEHNIVQGVSEFEFKSILMGARIEDISRTGKYIVIELSKAKKGSDDEWWYLLIHFTMTGGFTYKKHKNSRISFEFEEFDDWKLYYKDDRKWSKIWLYSGDQLVDHINSKKLGVDVLEANAYDIEMELISKINRSNKLITIKDLLLDQTTLSGLGNIYANEVLFHSKIHPALFASELTFDQIQKLSKSIVGVIQASYEAGGSSIKDFTDIFGNPGTYQDHHRVYGRKGLPCFNCKNKIERYAIGRSTFYCPHCQRRND